MTEQEAEALAARLTRVWAPNKPVKVMRDGEAEAGKRATWLLDAALCDGLELEVSTSEGNAPPSIRLTRWREGQQDRAFMLYDWTVEHTSELWPDELEALPFFRRGCWLSGCPIEATAHEKAEWVRDFTREEIDAWNLKI